MPAPMEISAEPGLLASSSGLRGEYIPSLKAEVLGRSQQMRIIRIHDSEARLGSRRQVNGVGPAKKDRCRQSLINVPDS